MTIPQQQGTVRLTHFGRRSNKTFQVTIWFAVIDGELWVGSLDETRSWVRNLRANGRARVDFGEGTYEMVAEPVRNPADQQRYREAVARKYPVLSRLVAVFGRGKKRAVFRLRAADGDVG